MVASIQGMNFYETYNQAKVAQTYVNSAQNGKSQKDAQPSESIKPVMNQEEIQDILHLEHVQTYVQDAFASENPELIQKEIETWKNLFDTNQKLQQPLEPLQLYKKVIAVNTYKKNA